MPCRGEAQTDLDRVMAQLRGAEMEATASAEAHSQLQQKLSIAQEKAEQSAMDRCKRVLMHCCSLMAVDPISAWPVVCLADICTAASAFLRSTLAWASACVRACLLTLMLACLPACLPAS